MTDKPADLFNLGGKVAVVTGGSRGIGRAVAEGLAAAGADVVIASRKFEACRQAAQEIEAATGSRALPVECNVSHWQQCDRQVSTALTTICATPSPAQSWRRSKMDFSLSKEGFAPTLAFV